MDAPIPAVVRAPPQQTEHLPGPGLDAFDLSTCKSPSDWGRLWRRALRSTKNETKAQEYKVLVSDVLAAMKAYTTSCVNYVLPPAQLFGGVQRAAWYEHLAEELQFIQAVIVVSDTCVKARRECHDNGASPALHAAISGFSEFLVTCYYPWMRQAVAMWCRNRRDDVVGASGDGGWVAGVRVSVFAFLCQGVRVWNRDFCKAWKAIIRSPFYELHNALCTEWSVERILIMCEIDMRPDTPLPSARALSGEEMAFARTASDQLQKWQAVGGMPLLPPLAFVPDALMDTTDDNPLIHVASISESVPVRVKQREDTYRFSPFWWTLDRRSGSEQHQDIPFMGDCNYIGDDERNKPPGLSVLMEWMRLCRTQQEEISWTPLWTWVTVCGLWSALCTYVTRDLGFLDSELTDDEIGEDVYERSDVDPDVWVIRTACLEAMERCVLYWCSWAHLHSSFLGTVLAGDARDDDPYGRRYVSMATMQYAIAGTSAATETSKHIDDIVACIVSEEECAAWCEKTLERYIETQRESKTRNMFREPFTSVMHGYLLRPGCIEEHLAEKGEISSRAYKDVIAAQRPTERTQLLLLVFNEYAPIHALHAAGVAGEKARSYLEEIVRQQRCMNSCVLDPLVDPRLKLNLYHRALPVIYSILQQAADLNNVFSSLMEGENAAEFLGIEAELAEKMAARGREAYKRQLSHLKKYHRSGKHMRRHSISSLDMSKLERSLAKATLVEKQRHRSRREGAHHKAAVKAAAPTAADIPSADFQTQFHVVNYANRCLEDFEKVQLRQFKPKIRGAPVPKGLWYSFYRPEHGLLDGACRHTATHDETQQQQQPWLAFIRGEFWVYRKNAFFGTTRCIEQAIKWYKIESFRWNAIGAENGLDSVAGDVFTVPSLQPSPSSATLADRRQ